jgi:hypothetical protein
MSGDEHQRLLPALDVVFRRCFEARIAMAEDRKMARIADANDAMTGFEIGAAGKGARTILDPKTQVFGIDTLSSNFDELRDFGLRLGERYPQPQGCM